MDLERFTAEHKIWYDYALGEVRAGKKYSHWMWFIFPQIKGLGRSDTAQYFAIQSREEAQAYLAHPVLNAHLREITQAMLNLKNTHPAVVLGDTDSMKLRSCMTLFHAVSGDPLYQEVLNRYYQGKPDEMTLAILNSIT